MFSCIFTAQVPDDEQFVPDFQSDNCEWLISVFLSLITVSMYLSPEQIQLFVIMFYLSQVPVWFEQIEKTLHQTLSLQKIDRKLLD